METVSLEPIIATAELDRRPARAPDLQGESEALVALTSAMRDPEAPRGCAQAGGGSTSPPKRRSVCGLAGGIGPERFAPCIVRKRSAPLNTAP